MALQFHLVQRKNLSKNVEVGKEKLYYAQTRATGTCSFDELCEIVAESSTASSGDVKVVIDRVIKFLLLFLARGRWCSVASWVPSSCCRPVRGV